MENIGRTQDNHGKDFVEMRILKISLQNNGKYGHWNLIKKVMKKRTRISKVY